MGRLLIPLDKGGIPSNMSSSPLSIHDKLKDQSSKIVWLGEWIDGEPKLSIPRTNTNKLINSSVSACMYIWFVSKYMHKGNNK